MGPLTNRKQIVEIFDECGSMFFMAVEGLSVRGPVDCLEPLGVPGVELAQLCLEV